MFIKAEHLVALVFEGQGVEAHSWLLIQSVEE